MVGLLTPEWLEGQIAGAPTDLAERTRYFFLAEPGLAGPETLAKAAQAALAAAIAQADDRRGALDLLAADALVTLALAAQVERDPAGLREFAVSLLAAEAGS